MRKQILITIVIGATIAGIGIWIGHFYGGMVTGAALIMMLTITVGRVVHAKLIKKMDKGIKDFILTRYKNN